MELSHQIISKRIVLHGYIQQYSRAFGCLPCVSDHQSRRISQHTWGCLFRKACTLHRTGDQILSNIDTLLNTGTNDRYYSSSSKFLKQEKKNYYSILKVSPKATPSQIKTAFYRLSVIHHPDKNSGNPDAQQKFSAIAEAYSVLSNAELRKKYDMEVSGYNASSSNSSFTATREREYRERGLDHRFDTWTQQHYNNARLRRQRSASARVEFKKRQQELRQEITDRRFTIGIFLLLISLAIGAGVVTRK